MGNAAGFDMPASEENSHEFEDVASWEEEHHDLNPNTIEEGSGSGWYEAFEEDEGTLSPMADAYDMEGSGSGYGYEDTYHYEGSGSGFYEGSADHYEGSGSGDYYYEGSGSGSGFYGYDSPHFDFPSTSEMPATDYHYGSGSGSGYRHKRKHNRHH